MCGYHALVCTAQPGPRVVCVCVAGAEWCKEGFSGGSVPGQTSRVALCFSPGVYTSGHSLAGCACLLECIRLECIGLDNHWLAVIVLARALSGTCRTRIVSAVHRRHFSVRASLLQVWVEPHMGACMGPSACTLLCDQRPMHAQTARLWTFSLSAPTCLSVGCVPSPERARASGATSDLCSYFPQA